jgi:uncharacterized protein (TIGR02246 family)
MKLLLLLCLLVAGCPLLSGCNTPDTSAADIKALSDTEVQWNQDIAAKDAAKMAAHYADGAVLMVGGQPSIVGHDALLKFFQTMTADPASSLKFHANKIEVAKSGDIGFAQGVYELVLTDPASKQVVHDHGSYVTTYRKAADGSWKAVDDVSSSEVPPTQPAK